MARRGFTLIELSIVLVIIGLLVGGILLGQSIMEAQKLRNTVQEAKAFAIAKQIFVDKYNYLPGDMPTATQVWGNADGGGDPTINCVAPETDVSVGKPTCNGDGNGVIDSSNSENFRAWQQLSAADLIVGSFTGVHGGGSTEHAVRGTNVPAATLDGAVFHWRSIGERADSASFYAGNYDNLFMLGAPVASSVPTGAALSGVEAFDVDTKVDDGKPAYGSVRTFAKTWMDANTGTCVSSDTAASAAYITTSDVPQCILLFMSTFQAKPE